MPESNITIMIIPIMILYQPKTLKPYLVRKLTNHLMANNATTKETTQPTASISKIIANPEGNRTTPSVVSFKNGEIIVFRP